MTADRRLRIGGWAALLTAVMVPVEFFVLFAVAHEPDPLGSTAFVAAETLRIVAALVAIVGLDGLFRSLAGERARIVLALGIVGATLGVAAGIADLVGIDTAPIDLPVFFATNLLIGLWFIGGGAILMREGGGLARIGWTAELGGLGMILTGIALATSLGGTLGQTGTSLNDWFRILGLFVTVFLVRVWSYVVRGKLPGPGIL